MTKKVCTTCKQVLPLDQFYRAKLGKFGRTAVCKKCSWEWAKQYRKTDRGHQVTEASQKSYRESPHGAAKRKAYRQTATARQSNENWRKKPAGLAYLAQYRKSDKRKAVLKRYYENGKGRAAIDRYQQTPKGRESLMRGVHKRRSKMAEIQSTLTAEEWEAIKKSQGYCCAICKKKMERLTRDHILPLSKGGQHTKDNIQALCRSCNSRKGNR